MTCPANNFNISICRCVAGGKYLFFQLLAVSWVWRLYFYDSMSTIDLSRTPFTPMTGPENNSDVSSSEMCYK
jgi:hypothetical protein